MHAADGDFQLPDPDLLAGLSSPVRRSWIRYFYTRPKRSGKTPGLRRHMLALYCPLAKRSVFPAGIRLCCNVYTGCLQSCGYCYARNYIPQQETPRPKDRFAKQAAKDLAELLGLETQPVPLHISNSTDPFQETMETRYRHTLQLMELVKEHRKLFSTITFLT